MSLSNWHTVALGEICDVYDGPHATPKKVEHGPVFLGISCLSNGRLDLSEAEHLSEEDYITWTRRIAPKTGDVVFSYETRIGEVAQIPDGLKCCLGRRMGLLRPNLSKVDPRFLLYAYLGPNFQNTLRARTVHGSTVNRIPIKELPSYPIEIPPLPIQKRIAEILGRLDDKIEVNRRINRTLEAMAQALYKHWFVDFGPFQDGPFVDSELGPIPEGWRVESVYSIANVIYGAPFASKLFNESSEGIPLIRIRDLSGQDPSVFTDELHPKGTKIHPGDIVVSMDGEFRSHLWTGPISWLNQRVCAFFPKDPSLRGFMHQSIRGPLAFWEQAKVGTTVIHLNKQEIDAIRIVFPTTDVLRGFTSVVELMYDLLVKHGLEIRKLSSIRDYLLPKLLSGEVPVTGADETIEKIVTQAS